MNKTTIVLLLSLPLAFHAGTHSGRVMKVMLGGAEAMWILSLNFFREHAASLALDAGDIQALAKNAFLASFLSDADKSRHIGEIDAIVRSMTQQRSGQA